MLDKLKSRKFWAAIVGMALFGAAGATGVIPTETAADKIQWVLMTYLGVQGGVDMVGENNKRKEEADARSQTDDRGADGGADGAGDPGR